MNTLVIRFGLILIALVMGTCFVPAATYCAVTARLYGGSGLESLKGMWTEAQFLAWCWLDAFKNPDGDDEDEVNGI